MTPKIFIDGLIKKYQVKIRFILVGGWNTIFGYFIFILLEEVFSATLSVKILPYILAMIFSNIAAIMNAFIFHKYITFKSKTKGIRVVVELYRFSLTYIITFILSLLLLPVFIELFSIHSKISGALVILCCTIVSYIGHSRYSFDI